MKKTILLLAMGVALTTQTIWAEVPSYVPTNGLVGYWPFNGNANDESGNGNNGTINGATLTTDRFGNSNSAYSFDGINDIITTNNFTNPLVDWTCSFWFISNNSSTFEQQNVLGFGQNSPIFGGPCYQINGGIAPGQCPEISSNLNKMLFSDATLECGNLLFSSLSVNNIWYFVTVKKQGTVYSIYVNGALINSGNLNDITLTNLSFGNRSQLNFQYFNGKIDDIGVWNRALTQQEITNLYNSSLPQSACLPANVPTSGLVGYWPFCGNANDESGNGNNGTVNGATLTTDRFGNSNSAYSFDGNNTHIAVPSNNSLQLINNYSINGWFNANIFFNTNISDRSIVSKVQSTGWYGGYEVMVGGTSNDITHVGNVGGNNFNVGSTGYSINTWYMFTATYNGNVMNLYMNGVLVNSQPKNGNLETSNLPLRFGMRDGNFQFFNGKIDDIGIWNRALTQQEITNLYNANLSFNDPVTWANNITIFPNPASSQININFNNITNLNGGTLKIINSLGQEVATTPITTSGINSTMQLATWGGTGMYFVQIINPQGQIVDIKKIILQ